MDLTAHQEEVLKSELQPYDVDYYRVDQVTEDPDVWEITAAGTDICGAIKMSINELVVLKTHIPNHIAESDDALRAWAAAAKRSVQPSPSL
ncbi:MAG TPA: hypothetical protein VNM67_21110 [Thermoanaerobaculia bacterium]|jgi:hypothetical protein|nr:hypothetical protein [Thermoanaerobaculia bacterium]